MADKLSGPAVPEVKTAAPATGPATLATGGGYPVEHWQLTKNTPSGIYAGLMAHAGWYSGKVVSEAEYDAARAAFLGGTKYA